MRGHPGAKESLLDFNHWFYTTMKAKETLETMQAITDACPCKASTLSDVTDRRLHSCLRIPYCRDTLMCVDFVAKKKFGSYNNTPVVTCALTWYTQVYPFSTTALARTRSRPLWRPGSGTTARLEICPKMRTFSSGLRPPGTREY